MKIDARGIKNRAKDIKDNVDKVANKATKSVANAASNTGKKVVQKIDVTKEHIVKKMDQNDDNTFDKEDLKIAKDKIANKTQETVKKIKSDIDEKKRERELKKYRPVKIEDLESTEFNMPKIVNVSDLDKKFTEIDVCKDAIGSYLNKNDVLILRMFREYVDKFNIELYPNDGGAIYIMDPIDRNRYISLNDYFSYINKAYVRELKMIANELGASYFEVSLMEEKVFFSQEIKELEDKLKYASMGSGEAKTKRKKSSNELSFVKIEAKNNFEPHEPRRPKLKYLKNNEEIQQLIDFRMNKSIKDEELSINLGSVSGIKESEATKIDCAFKILKLNTNSSFESEYKNECRKYLKYVIKF